MNINKKIDDLFEKMDTTYLETHPNIINMWKKFINKRYNLLINNIKSCEEVLKTLENKADLTDMEIITLYNIYNQETN